MAHNWSKHSVIFNSIENNCYEAVHCWDASCSRVFMDMFLASLKGAIQVYVPLYMLPLLVRRDISKNALLKVATNAATSTTILAVNSSLVIGLTCFVNQFTGKIYYLSPFFNSLVSHFLAFKYERTSRRNSLAMFTLKSTGEIIFAYLAEKYGIFGKNSNPKIQKFLSILLFSSSLSANYYLLKKASRRQDLIQDAKENIERDGNIERDRNIEHTESDDKLSVSKNSVQNSKDVDLNNNNIASSSYGGHKENQGKNSSLNSELSFMKTDPLIQILEFISGREEIYECNISASSFSSSASSSSFFQSNNDPLSSNHQHNSSSEFFHSNAQLRREKDAKKKGEQTRKEEDLNEKKEEKNEKNYENYYYNNSPERNVFSKENNISKNFRPNIQAKEGKKKKKEKFGLNKDEKEIFLLPQTNLFQSTFSVPIPEKREEKEEREEEEREGKFPEKWERKIWPQKEVAEEGGGENQRDAHSCSEDAETLRDANLASEKYTNLNHSSSVSLSQKVHLGDHYLTSCCPNHPGKSCIQHSIGRVMKCFTVGFLTQSSILMLKYFRGGKVPKSTSGVRVAALILSDKNSLKFPLFLSSLSFTHRAISCLLRRQRAGNFSLNLSDFSLNSGDFSRNSGGFNHDKISKLDENGNLREGAKTGWSLSTESHRLNCPLRMDNRIPSTSSLDCSCATEDYLDSRKTINLNSVPDPRNERLQIWRPEIWRPEMESMISGFFSSFLSSYLFYDSNQITLYCSWKTAFTIYWYLLANHPNGQKIMDYIFFISDSFLINCMIMEPQFIANSYLRFVDSITGNMLKKPNIICYQQLTQRVNERRYGSIIPTLNADHASQKYLALTGVWSLENK